MLLERRPVDLVLIVENRLTIPLRKRMGRGSSLKIEPEKRRAE
jgi:hypothetical protein